MDRRLVDVSQAGNIEAFHALLEDQPDILDYIDQVPFTRTPLHIAILAKNTSFATHVARLKPSFITKLDCSGYTPIHLAAQNGQVIMVRTLLEISSMKSIGFVRGYDNKTPLHVAVISGKVEVVKYLVDAYNYPGCIFDLTVKNETALHLAVKNNQLGVLTVLLEWLKLAHQQQLKISSVSAVCSPCLDNRQVVIDVGGIDHVLNWKDEDGNTILHLATMINQPQMIEALLSISSNNPCFINYLDVNSLNGQKLSSLDIFLQFPSEKRDANIQEMFHKAGAMTTKQTNNSSPSSSPLALKQHINANYPTSCNILKSRNLYMIGMDVVFAIIMVTTCLVTATSIRFYPFLIFNMLGFSLSLSTLVSASSILLASRKLVVIVALVGVLGAYVFLIFSTIARKDRALFGGILLSIGAVIARVHARMEWHVRDKHCMKQKKFATSHLDQAEP